MPFLTAHEETIDALPFVQGNYIYIGIGKTK